MGLCLTKLSKEKNHGVISKSSPFNALPEECISKIISFTSPRDACVAASVSKTFGSAVHPDSVWAAEYPSLIPQSKIFSSKKELFFALCNDSFLIEDNTMRLWFDKASGKKCILLFDNNLEISWKYAPEWILSPTYRLIKLSEQFVECQFKIDGVMNSRILSPKTRYSAYVVYKRREILIGFGLLRRGASEAERQERKHITNAEEREDGLMEVEFAEFINDGELMDSLNCDEIKMKIMDIRHSYLIMHDLSFKGIELRPVK